MKPIRILPAATIDIEDAAEWYEFRRDGLGIEFVLELDAVLESIQSNPSQYPLVFLSFHRALVRRFPYAIYFLSRQSEILVSAVLHQARSDETISQRLR